MPHPGAPPPEIERIMSDIFAVQDMEPLDLVRKFKFVSHLINNLLGDHRKEVRLSHARIRVLMWLEINNRQGNTDGVTPSEISQTLGVSRNTISALLNGLEEQALIVRTLHPTDRRQFLIRISPTGQDLIRVRAPGFAAFATSLFEALTPTEQETLSALLDKLQDSLLERAASVDCCAHVSKPELSTDAESA